MSVNNDHKIQVTPLLGKERFCAVLVSVLMFAAVVLLHLYPATEQHFQIESNGTWRLTESSLDTTYLSLGASALAWMLLVYAINGLRLTRIAAGQYSGDFENKSINSTVKNLAPETTNPSAEEEEVEALETTAVPQVVETPKGAFEMYQLSELPVKVIQDAIEKWPTDNNPPKDYTDYEFTLRKRGRGNHPWIIKFRDRSPVAVKYGGQSKAEATVTKA